jgi:hypothetical protein
MITSELVKNQPTKLVNFIENQLIDFVRKSKRENYHFLSFGKEVSEEEFNFRFDNLLSMQKDYICIQKSYNVEVNLRGHFNYFTQEMWFSFCGEDDVLPSHNHLKFITSVNQPISVSLVLDKFYQKLSEVVKNYFLKDEETKQSILYDFVSCKSDEYYVLMDETEYLVLDKQDWLQNPTEEPGDITTIKAFLSLIKPIDFHSLSESDSEKDKLFLKLFKNSLMENLIPNYDSENPLRTSLGINLAYSFESNFLKLKVKHKEKIEKLFKMFSLLLSQDEIDTLFTSLSKNNYFKIDKFLLSYLKFEKVIEQDVDFSVKLIYNSMRSIKSGELSPEFFLGLVDFVKEDNLLELFNKLSLTVTITDRNVQKILDDNGTDSQEAKNLLKLLSLVKKSKSVVYYKLTDIKKIETITLESIQNVWGDYRNCLMNETAEELILTRIETISQAVLKKIFELTFHLDVAKKCQTENLKQGLKLLVLYKKSLEEIVNNLYKNNQINFDTF